MREKINFILAEWDLLGCCRIHPDSIYTEYLTYVKPIIKFYNENGDTYEYLKKLFIDMVDLPDVDDLKEIRLYADRINLVILKGQVDSDLP